VKVIGVGDNTVDRYLHLGMMFPGGNAVNVAVFAHRSGHQAAYLGWLAKDPHSMLVYSALIEEGLDVSHCRQVEGENAFCEISLMDGDRIFGAYSEGVCSQIELNDADLNYISGFDLTHTSVYSHVDAQLKKLKDASQTLSYDFSQEWSRNLLENILPLVDIALLSNPVRDIGENEELIRWAFNFGPDIVIVTSGDKGVLLLNKERLYFQPVIKVENMVDSLGAGDAFAARFMVHYLSGSPIQEALQDAACFAAEKCQYHGAFGHGTPLFRMK